MKTKLILFGLLLSANIFAQTTYVIQSKTALTFNKVGSVVGSDTSHVVGVIISETASSSYQFFQFEYIWYKSDYTTAIKSGFFTIQGAMIDSLYTLVKPSLPNPITSWRDYRQKAAYIGMMLQGAQTWSVSPSNFELKIR